MTEIAEVAKCDPGTIENANKGETTLSLEIFSRLFFYFDPECFEPWLRLCRPVTAPELTPGERLARVERDIEAIRKEIAA